MLHVLHRTIWCSESRQTRSHQISQVGPGQPVGNCVVHNQRVTNPTPSDVSLFRQLGAAALAWWAGHWANLPIKTKRTFKSLAIGIAVICLFVGFFLGRIVEVPGSEKFWSIGAQPMATLLAAGAAVLAGALAFMTGLRSREQDREHHCSERSWSRLQWVIDKGSSTNPDAGLDEGLRDAILTEIELEAAKLDDESLKKAVTFYTLQVSVAFAATDLIE